VAVIDHGAKVKREATGGLRAAAAMDYYPDGIAAGCSQVWRASCDVSRQASRCPRGGGRAAAGR